MKIIRLIKISTMIIATGCVCTAYAQNNLKVHTFHLAEQNVDSSTSTDTSTDTGTSTNTLSDASITTKVKSMFVSEELFGSEDVSVMSIEVETINGVVHLKGTADNQEQIDNATTISQSIDGVSKVINDITIKEE